LFCIFDFLGTLEEEEEEGRPSPPPAFLLGRRGMKKKSR
jgi:hypothetical protein